MANRVARLRSLVANQRFYRVLLLAGTFLFSRLRDDVLAPLVVDLKVALLAETLRVMRSDATMLALGRLLQATALVVALGAQIACINLPHFFAGLTPVQAMVLHLVGLNWQLTLVHGLLRHISLHLIGRNHVHIHALRYVLNAVEHLHL